MNNRDSVRNMRILFTSLAAGLTLAMLAAPMPAVAWWNNSNCSYPESKPEQKDILLGWFIYHQID